MVDLSQAIWSLRPNSEFTFKNDDYATIEWHVIEGNPPTKAEVSSALKKLQDEEKAAKATNAIAKTALLERLGITADEAALLLS
jgi:hypothetical protein